MRFVCFFFVLLFSISAHCEITEEGIGVLFGSEHLFAAKAEKGWVLDNQSGTRQGVHMLFYPLGETWAKSPVMIYGRSATLPRTTTIGDFVKKTEADFHNNGSPDYKGKYIGKIYTVHNKSADIYHYSGDQWGNFEAVAYFRETDSVNFLVFNARTKESFDKYVSDFERIAKSYVNMFKSPQTTPKGLHKQLKEESDSHIVSEEGQQYEKKAVSDKGRAIANIMRGCFSYMKDEEFPDFEYLVRINKNGNIDGSYVFPTNSLTNCFRGLMMFETYPKHNFETFVLSLNMKSKQ